MSCEDVCIRGDSDDGCEWSTEKTLKARITHKCCECAGEIHPKDSYERVVLKYDGDIYSYKTCMICCEIRDAFYCNGGGVFGSVWNDIEEQLFAENFSIKCLERVKSSAAKKKLLDNWNGWKGL